MTFQLLIFLALAVLQPVVNFFLYKEEKNFTVFIGLITNVFVFSMLAIVSTSFETSIFILMTIYLLLHFLSNIIFLKGSYSKAIVAASAGLAITFAMSMLLARFAK